MTDRPRGSYFSFPAIVFFQMLSIFKTFALFNLVPVLFCKFCFTSMPRSLLLRLPRLSPRFQCTSTRMARLFELFITSIIAKLMFTSSVFCSSFASVEHFVKHFTIVYIVNCQYYSIIYIVNCLYCTIVYIVHSQPASGLHLKPLYFKHIADNKHTSFISFI